MPSGLLFARASGMSQYHVYPLDCPILKLVKILLGFLWWPFRRIFEELSIFLMSLCIFSERSTFYRIYALTWCIVQFYYFANMQLLVSLFLDKCSVKILRDMMWSVLKWQVPISFFRLHCRPCISSMISSWTMSSTLRLLQFSCWDTITALRRVFLQCKSKHKTRRSIDSSVHFLSVRLWRVFG